VDLSGLGYDPTVIICEDGNVPKDSKKGGDSLAN
jgi:hypothetical protein